MVSVKHDVTMPELVHCHVNGNGNDARYMSQKQNFVTKDPVLQQYISLYIRISRFFKNEHIEVYTTVQYLRFGVVSWSLRLTVFKAWRIAASQPECFTKQDKSRRSSNFRATARWLWQPSVCQVLKRRYICNVMVAR